MTYEEGQRYLQRFRQDVDFVYFLAEDYLAQRRAQAEREGRTIREYDPMTGFEEVVGKITEEEEREWQRLRNIYRTLSRRYHEEHDIIKELTMTPEMRTAKANFFQCEKELAQLEAQKAELEKQISEKIKEKNFWNKKW